MSNILKHPFNESFDRFAGYPSAPIELLMYGDFQCEFCGDVYVVIKLLQEYLGDDLKFVFRHYPLLTLHPLSLDAAVACEAAASQGMFWAMYDKIYANQRYLVRSSFSRFAEEIGLQINKFENSREHKKLIRKVIGDFESGVKSGVDGTPTFFINGRRYNGFEDFQSLFKTCSYAINLNRMAYYI